MKKIVVLLFCIFLFTINVSASTAKESILVEFSTGEILIEENSLEHRAPASMTNIMTT